MDVSLLDSAAGSSGMFSSATMWPLAPFPARKDTKFFCEHVLSTVTKVGKLRADVRNSSVDTVVQVS